MNIITFYSYLNMLINDKNNSWDQIHLKYYNIGVQEFITDNNNYYYYWYKDIGTCIIIVYI